MPGTAARTALHGYLNEVHTDSGRLVLLTGPLLSGKTALVEEFTRDSRERGLPVLTASCSRFSRHDLLGVPWQLLRGRRLPPESVTPAQAIETALLGIHELAAAGRLIVCVDDIRHADPASVRFLEALTAGVGRHPVLVVVTDRTDATHSSIRFRGRLDQLRHVRNLALTPLSESEVADLARTEFALHDTAGRFAERVRRLSGGNAFLARALLQDHAVCCGCHGEREENRPPLIGPAYRQAVLDCLHRVEPDTREMAEALAVADGFSASQVVAELARMDLRAVEESAAELATCGLVEDGGFRHPAVREVILGDMPRNRRSELSARAAMVLRAAGAPTEDVARWLSGMDDVDHAGTRAPRTPPRARWKAAGGRTKTAVAAAGTLGTRPGAEEENERVPGQRRPPAGRSTGRGTRPSPVTGPDDREGDGGGTAAPAGRRHCPEPGRHSTPASAPASGAGPAAELEDHRTLWLAEDELALLDRRIAAVSRPESPEPLALGARRLLLGCAFPSLLRDVRSRERPARRVLEERLTRAPHYTAAWALAGVLAEDGCGSQEAVRMAKRALYGCDPTRENLPAIMAALATVVRHDDPEQASFWCERFAGGPAWPAAHLRVVRAEIGLRGGDPATAAAQAEKALDLLPARLWGIRLAEPLACSVLAHVAAGNPAAVAVLLPHKVPDYLFDTRYGLDYLYARGLYRLAVGESLAALADFLRCGGLMADWGIDRHRHIPWRLAVAAAYVTMNEYGKAVERIDETFGLGDVDALAGAGAGPGQDSAGAGAACDRARFRESVFEALRETAATPDLFRTLEGFRKGRLKTGQNPEMRRYKIYDRHSAYLEKLSPSEQRVAVLAAKGDTNQQIAHNLSVTVSTVEQHLTRIYRKLQLAGRGDLRAKLG
ncbi:AAA family ATPase [Streptomyces ziwulingensis]|uniref:AAA family ATPase n=1 Tax=Streptomyces ziwulingensis TaxID=1045501 RepID=UPI0031E5DD2D